MMKKIKYFILCLIVGITAACSHPELSSGESMEDTTESIEEKEVTDFQNPLTEDEILIELSDWEILVDNELIGTDPVDPVYLGAGIVYYEEGKGETYGEGTENDEHSEEEALSHKVVTITQPGTYRISGVLSKGQIAVDLGKDASEDKNAVVVLILDNAEITCTLAPAVIFYNVWESESLETAGANVILADDSVNTVRGSYVARIYQENSTKKLHKYDGAFYSKMTMAVGGASSGNGILYIYGENEGLDSEMHLIINGGNIYIEAEDDGINTNEDDVSVTIINGGYLYIHGGLGPEGDGIDSNGSLIINGGTVISYAHSTAGDGGLDADGDILLNGGTVIAFGTRNDTVSPNSEQVYLEVNFQSLQSAGTLLRVEDEEGNEVLTFEPLRDYQSFTFTSPELSSDKNYLVYTGGEIAGVNQVDGWYEKGGEYSGGALAEQRNTMMPGMPPFGRGERGERPDIESGWEERGERPEMGEISEMGERPGRGERPEMGEPPEIDERP